MKGNKIMSAMVAIIMVLSAVVILSELGGAALYTDMDGKGWYGIVLSNDGSGEAHDNLTCGELITLYVMNNSLTPGEDYAIKVHNGTGWVALDDVGSTDNADEYGDLAIQFHVPGFAELADGTSQRIPNRHRSDPNLAFGQWNISLFEESTGYEANRVWPSINITITINNLYDVYFTSTASGSYSSRLTHLTYGEEEEVYIQVRNWTGGASGWQEDADGTDGIGVWNVDVYAPGPTSIAGFPITQIDADNQYAYIEAYHYAAREYNFWVNVTKYASTINGSWSSNVTLPVKLNMTATSLPSAADWGDDFTLGGKLYDANGSAISSYAVAAYAPIANGYRLIGPVNTMGNGAYSIPVDTGPDEGYSAGVWYLGTKADGAIDEGGMPPYVDGFIPYFSFEVDTYDTARVGIENVDEIVSDFDQTINVSVKNESYMWSGDSDTVLEHQKMKIHVTGLDSWNSSNRIEYDDDDIVLVTPYRIHQNDDYSYYLFNHTFNQTGTATVLVSWVGNQTSHTIATSPKGPGNDSSYSNTFNLTGARANITGSATLTIGSPDDMNLIINNMVDAVSISKGPGALSADRWINSSAQFLLQVFGATQSDPQNATINVSGCGLDFSIDEDDPSASSECVGYPGDGTYTAGQYLVEIAPKTAGTLTITATNDTTSVSKDYEVTGLTGTVTTSVGDDKEITVGTTETITVQLTTAYATIHVTYFDTSWTQTDAATDVLNTTTGDGTAGEGAGGAYTFVPDEETLEGLGRGYIVIAAEAGSGNYMYDIVEIVPIYDFTIELISPINVSQLFTVGLEHDVVFQILDADGNIVDEDTPYVTVVLTDENHDEDNPLQSWSSDNGDVQESGEEWEFDDMVCWWEGTLIITGRNASDGITHSGNLSIGVAYGTLSYSPAYATAGINQRNLTVTVTGTDANGDPMPDGTDVYFWVEDGASEDTDVGGSAGNTNAVNFRNADTSIALDENGEGEFDLLEVGDNKTTINGTLVAFNASMGNRTNGVFNIDFPTFDMSHDTIYIGQSNILTIYTYEADGETAIVGLNLTLFGAIDVQPDPVETSADGKVIFKLEPESSGIVNVTIARNVRWVGGDLQWDNAVITDSYVTIDSLGTFAVALSKSPIFEGETLTVTVTDGTAAVEDATVSFGEETTTTDANGEATFTVPDPGVESAIYTVTVEKNGYITKEKSLTVIKVWTITIVAPDEGPFPNEEFTVTILAKGQALAGAEVTMDGVVKVSKADGTVTFTAGELDAVHTITAVFGTYEDGTLTLTVVAGTPGFELLTLIAAIGVAFILLRRRRK